MEILKTQHTIVKFIQNKDVAEVHLLLEELKLDFHGEHFPIHAHGNAKIYFWC